MAMNMILVLSESECEGVFQSISTEAPFLPTMKNTCELLDSQIVNMPCIHHASGMLSGHAKEFCGDLHM